MEIAARIGQYFAAMSVPLEVRIRELCAKAISTQDSESLQIVLPQLRAALREHHLHLKAMVAESLKPALRREKGHPKTEETA